MRDEYILELFWKRDENAIAEAEARYGTYCLSIAENILHNREDAGECVNEVFFRAWNSIPPARPKALKLFLAKITRNLAFDVYKRKNAEKRGSGETSLILDELGECISSDSTEDAVFGKALAHTINRFVRTLPKREQGIFVRRYFYADTVVEISKRFGISQGYVKSSLSRTRQKLREQLIKEGYII